MNDSDEPDPGKCVRIFGGTWDVKASEPKVR